MPRPVVVRSVFFALLGSLTFSCGSRTSLELPELCPDAGETRSCEGTCGTGVETCRNGAWSQCEVPPVVRGCLDGCGAGEESCVNGEWQPCVVPEVKRVCESVCGSGFETCSRGVWKACDAPLPKPPKLRVIVRDFSPRTHPDFEANYPGGLDLGIVESSLGPDDKPAYAGMPSTKSTSGALNFDQWFRDVPMVNERAELDLQLVAEQQDSAMFTYDDRDFFPIENQLLGNEGRAHNFHFTLEASTTFRYVGGEVFSFSGDDDMWVFVNRQLVIDLGGLHQTLSAEVSLDALSGSLGLQKGEIYPLHFFFAERHTVASNFTIRTSIADRGSCE